MSVASTIFLCIFLLHHTCRSEPLAGWSEPARRHEFLFVVSIARKFDITADNPYGHVCGGALVNRRHALTAASCFDANRTENDYFVYLGSHDLALSGRIGIDKLTTYDTWLRHTTCKLDRLLFQENDIALVKLSSVITSPARPAKMASIPSMGLVGMDVITAGWGLRFTDNVDVPRYMLKANLRVINDSRCFENVRTVSNDPTYVHQENYFCTNGVTLFAVLDEGDKGSPVFVKDASGEYRIVGVNQKAVPSVNDVVLIPDQQNKHVNVYYYFDFIRIVARIRSVQD